MKGVFFGTKKTTVDFHREPPVIDGRNVMPRPRKPPLNFRQMYPYRCTGCKHLVPVEPDSDYFSCARDLEMIAMDLEFAHKSTCDRWERRD